MILSLVLEIIMMELSCACIVLVYTVYSGALTVTLPLPSCTGNSRVNGVVVERIQHMLMRVAVGIHEVSYRCLIASKYHERYDFPLWHY